MAPLIYPEPTWSNGFGRVVRTLQVVAIAGAIGAVGGGVAVMALVGGHSSRHPTALIVGSTDQDQSGPKSGPKSGPADTGKTGTADDAAAHAASAAAAPHPNAAAPAAAEASKQSPAAAEPSSNVAAIEQHPDPQAAEPASSSLGTPVYDHVEPDKNVQAKPPRSRAKLTRRTKNAEHGRRERSAPYATDDNRYSDARGNPYPAVRGGRYWDDRGGPYSGERYSYRDYDPPPVVRAQPRVSRGYYFGGGGFYDRGGGWGN